MFASKHSENFHVVLMDKSLNYGHPKVNIYSSVGRTFSGDDEGSYLFKSIRGFLIFGKFIGCLPYSGIFGNSWKELSFRKTSTTAFISYGITLIVMFNASIGIYGSARASRRNALEIAEAIRPTLLYVWACLIYINFICRSREFLNIFKTWSSTEVKFFKKDATLWRDASLIAGVILVSAIFENAVLHLEYFSYFDTISGAKWTNQHDNITILETYYRRAHPQWERLLGYHYVFAVVGFIQHKWTLYSVNYIDIAIAVFARALYFRFKSLCEEAQNKLLNSDNTRPYNTSGIFEKSAWLQLVRDHQKLLKQFDVLENFFSPIVFASYFINTFYICLQLFDGIKSEVSTHSIVSSIYTPWSFLHLVMRAFIVSICCARINVHAHRIGNLLQKCPAEYYTTEISRVDRIVTAGPNIGFTGLGCFTVTKPFILSMLSVIFTCEIVLLQS